jgi:hypothetical protein
LNEFNIFLANMWRKYHYAAIVEMANKFRTKLAKLDPRDDYFATLPMTHITTQNFILDFEEYSRSDLLIEIIRSLKIRVLTEELKHREYEEELVAWAIENILDADEEEIFNAIFEKL